MCYSAKLLSAWRDASRLEPDLDFQAFERLFRKRWEEEGSKTYRMPRMMDLAFEHPKSPEEARIKEWIDKYRVAQAADWEQEMFKQARRLADAQRKLAVKPTQAALKDERIATSKIAQLKGWLQALRSADPLESDARIFPMWYAPVIVMEGGRYVMRPMRYHCRPAGMPESMDRDFDGVYNARRDSLESKRMWKGLFGRSHAIMLATGFYENVALHDFEHRALREGEKQSSVELHFNPRGDDPMFFACLWDRWSAPGKEDLLSFAVITDEPPPEVAATGHDRCPIPIKRENIDAWLNPAGQTKEALHALLENRARPFYEHRLAA